MSYPDHLLTTNHGLDGIKEDCHKLNAHLTHLNHSLDLFWRRRRQEYLSELCEVHRHHYSSGKPQLVEGDIVVVYSDNQPHSCWRLGQIERVFTGTDGRKRTATVRVSNNGRTFTLDWPIQHLYPLEIVSHSNTVSEQEIEEVCEPTEHDTLPEQPASRPRRSAATQAHDHILAQAISGSDN